MEVEYGEVTMPTGGSTSLSGVEGFTELVASRRGEGWDIDSIVWERDQLTIKFQRQPPADPD